jgi:pyruvate kinase
MEAPRKNSRLANKWHNWLGSEVKTPAMKEKDDKMIHFNFKNQFHGAKEPIDDDSE